MRFILPAMLLVALTTRASGQQTYILTTGVDGGAQEAGKRDQYAQDAREMKLLLEKKCAYPIASSHCLPGKKAELKAYLDKLDSIRKSATEKDMVLLYFSVHGGTGKKGNFSVNLADDILAGKVLAKECDGIKASVVIFLDTCGAGGMLNHSSTNPRVCIFAGCKSTEETGGGKRDPFHGFYTNGIHAMLTEDGKRNLTLNDVDRFLADPRSVKDSEHQHAVASVPKELASMVVFKR